MTSIAEREADRLEALVEMIETAQATEQKVVLRNTQAWIAAAVLYIEEKPVIDEAASKALSDSVRFAETLGIAFDDQAEVEQVRLSALTSVRAFQACLVSAAQASAAQASLPNHC